jgi:hypothetical protein
MQLHVPPTDHISFAHNCLHLWRPIGVEIPQPPRELVGAPADNGMILLEISRVPALESAR